MALLSPLATRRSFYAPPPLLPPLSVVVTYSLAEGLHSCLLPWSLQRELRTMGIEVFFIILKGQVFKYRSFYLRFSDAILK